MPLISSFSERVKLYSFQKYSILTYAYRSRSSKLNFTLALYRSDVMSRNYISPSTGQIVAIPQGQVSTLNLMIY